jgi:hypothetical protein
MKPQSPPVWVVLCHDVDGKIYAFEIANTLASARIRTRREARRR